VDAVERIVLTPFQEAPQGTMPAERAVVRHMVNPEGETTLVLSPEALEPGCGDAYRGDAERT
jgi:hypothetical protein